MYRFVGNHELIGARWLAPLVTLVVLALSLLVSSEDADARFDESFDGAAAIASLAGDGLLCLENTLLPAVPTAAARPANPGDSIYPGDSLGGLFSRPGLLGGFAAGFLGAGLIGLLFGHGVVGELSGVASVLGLLFQLALIAMLARLIWTWWHDKDADARAALSPRQLAEAYGRTRHEVAPADIDPAATVDGMGEETERDALAKNEPPQA